VDMGRGSRARVLGEDRRKSANGGGPRPVVLIESSPRKYKTFVPNDSFEKVIVGLSFETNDLRGVADDSGRSSCFSRFVE
jgi:hypothetical protein